MRKKVAKKSVEQWPEHGRWLVPKDPEKWIVGTFLPRMEGETQDLQIAEVGTSQDGRPMFLIKPGSLH